MTTGEKPKGPSEIAGIPDTGQPWAHEWKGEKKKPREISPQNRALISRKKAGRKACNGNDTRARVQEIVTMMLEGDWVRGKSVPKLATLWMVSESRVDQLAAEASRMVAAQVMNPDHVSATVTGLLSSNIHRASDDRAYTAVAKIADVWTRIVGARAPERHEHSVIIAQFTGMKRTDKVAWLDIRIAKLQEVRAQLVAEEAMPELMTGE